MLEALPPNRARIIEVIEVVRWPVCCRADGKYGTRMVKEYFHRDGTLLVSFDPVGCRSTEADERK